MIDVDFNVTKGECVPAGREAPNEKRDTHSFFFYFQNKSFFLFFIFIFFCIQAYPFMCLKRKEGSEKKKDVLFRDLTLEI